MASPAETSVSSISAVVEKSKKSFLQWSLLSTQERAQRLLGLLPLFEQHGEALARTATREMGKPIRQARAEVQRCREAIPFFCEKCPAWLEPEESPGGKVYFDPLGIVALISPWNFPYALAFLAAIPALIAGNALILKPSEYSLECGAALQALFEKVAPGVVSTVLGGKRHGEVLVQHPLVAMVALTGSSAAGKKVMGSAAERLCRVSLELGGIDAAIVLDDIDPVAAAAAIVARNCSNAGQVCCAVKQVYVARKSFHTFAAAAAQHACSLKIGDPLDPATDIGPIVNQSQLQSIIELVSDATAKGARILCGGTASGQFFPPTLLTEITDQMRLVREECFGPVLPILPYDSVSEVIDRINHGRYGLTASVWTTDLARGEAIARQLEVGVAQVNAHGIPPLGAPWGGARESGLGRTRSRDGVREFTNTKYVRLLEPPAGRTCRL